VEGLDAAGTRTDRSIAEHRSCLYHIGGRRNVAGGWATTNFANKERSPARLAPVKEWRLARTPRSLAKAG
jgi:hypothetical protein